MKQSIFIMGIAMGLISPLFAQRVVKLSAFPPKEKIAVSISVDESNSESTPEGDIVTVTANAKGGSAPAKKAVQRQRKFGI